MKPPTALKLLLILGVLGVAPIGYTDDLKPDWRAQFVSPEMTLHVRALGGGESRVTELVGRLERLNAHPFFARLPRPWGVLIDGEWKRSAGYFGPETLTPAGDPAVLFSDSILKAPGGSAGGSDGLIAHEMTHLLHWRFRPQEEIWVREGVAMLGEWLVTGQYSPVIIEAYAWPETSLTIGLSPWEEGFANRSLRTAQYGHVLQYFAYIFRLCGKEALLERLLTSPSRKTGESFVDEVLRESGSLVEACTGFRASFEAFSRARFLSNASRPQEWVLATGLSSAVREAPWRELPPYSSQAYRVRSGARCQANDLALEAGRCLRIRRD